MVERKGVVFDLGERGEDGCPTDLRSPHNLVCVTAPKENQMSAQPFTIQIDDDVLSDLQQRLQRPRWPDEIPGTGWDYGTNLDYLKQLVAYWRDAYDWRAQERLLNRFPPFHATIDGFGLPFPHVKGKGRPPRPLLTH